MTLEDQIYENKNKEGQESKNYSDGILSHKFIEDFAQYEKAGFWTRFFAAFIDGVVVNVLLSIVFGLIGLSGVDSETITDAEKWILLKKIGVIFFAVTVLYQYLPLVLWGQTLGKKILGIRVINGDFTPKLTILKVLFRETVGKLLSAITIYFGFIMAGITKEKRALHDLIVDTRVVKYRKN